jgi:hypothetical protein
MQLEDIADHLADKLIEAIKTHDECIISQERVTSAKYDEEIEYDGEGLLFALPLKLKGQKDNIRVKLKFEFDYGTLPENFKTV